MGCSALSCAVQVDPYVIVSIKENRKQRTKTLSNNNHPVWNETITTIINDPDTQSITFKLMDDDIGSFDTVSMHALAACAACLRVSPLHTAALSLQGLQLQQER